MDHVFRLSATCAKGALDVSSNNSALVTFLQGGRRPHAKCAQSPSDSKSDWSNSLAITVSRHIPSKCTCSSWTSRNGSTFTRRTQEVLNDQREELQNKVNSWSDSKKYEPESRRSSGATHVPDQTSTILSSRTLPRCDSGLPRNTQNCMGTTGNVFERLPAQEGLFSTILNNSKNLASSSQELRPDTTGTTRRRESEIKRESLNTSTPSTHFQSRSGMLHHTGGTYSHDGMLDYPRFPIAELHLGKFPDSLEFQSWNVNFRTEVYLRTADAQIRIHWIKEVEIAKSIDELMTSRSIVWRTDFLDFDMLDAMIASALKRLLDKHIHFRKRVSVDEQRAQQYDLFLRGKHFRATGAYEAVQGLSDLFTTSLQKNDVQDFDVRWDHVLLSASDMPSDVILDGLYKSKLQDSFQLQTVVACMIKKLFDTMDTQVFYDWKRL